MSHISKSACLAAAMGAALVAGCSISPEKLGAEKLSQISKDNLLKVTAAQEPVTGPIGLYEAMARALKYNLDHHVEVYQAALRHRELTLAHFEMLPKVVADSGFAKRDNYSATTSQRVDPNTGDLAGAGAFQSFNTSQEKSLRTADIELSWHVLDFGLSYVRARQSADKALIANEVRRKVINRVIEDVRTAFWRALTADRLLSRLQHLESRTRAALANSRKLARESQTSPVTALTYERELVEIKMRVQELQRDLTVAKTQLAALMNLKPGTRFRLRTPRYGTVPMRMPGSAHDMIWTAVNNRPELRQNAYRKRINMHEADAALLSLLPGLQLYAGTNYDSNDFLLNSNWLSWGAKASWNLMKLVQYPAQRRVIEGQDALLEKRALALTMAVMTQVHVARVRFHHHGRELRTASEYFAVQKRLIAKMRAEAAAGRISDQTLIREEMNTMVAEVKRDIAYARVQNSYANMYAAMGLDPYYGSYGDEISVSELTGRLRKLWVERGRRGHRPTVMKLASKG